MKLQKFEGFIDDVILERGRKYFQQGHVEKINEVDRNRYSVQVVGSENYAVEILLDDTEEIVKTYCDCPYDLGEYCKHQVAAFFALREKLSKEKNLPKAAEELSIANIISNLQRNELIQIILTISEENPDIEKGLLFKYAPAKDEISSSKKIIREYINNAKRNRFIEWRDVGYALKGAEMTLEKAREKIEMGDTKTAVLLCITVLSIVVEMLQYCDDSNGYVGDAINESLAIIDDAVFTNLNRLTDRQKSEIFDPIMKEALHKRYDGWEEWSRELLKTCIYFSGNTTIRKKIEKQFNKMLDSIDGNSWRSNHDKENIKLLQLELMERNNEEEKARQFILDNIKYSSFREKEINRLMEKEKYEEVIQLCAQGETADKEYRGLVHKWEKYRFQAYEALGDIPKQREMALQFLYENEFSYYHVLKTLYQQGEWKEIFQGILENFEKQSYLPSAYLEILKEEKLYEKLLDYCKSHLSSIEDFYPYLVENYFDEVNLLFKNFIETSAEEASDRKKYKIVCKKIKTYKKVCGEIHAHQLINGLKRKYIRRPAFVDELGKIK